MSSSLRIALIEPFYTGSHKRWADALALRSRHDLQLFALPGRHWKWRMHGAAITLAEELLACETQFDAILATDMLDLGVLLGLIRHRYANTPVALYFHENQLAYPWSPTDPDTELQRDRHYAFLNYTGALAANQVYFNSDYNRTSLLEALPDFLDAYPDYRNTHTIDTIARKCRTLPLGLDLAELERHRTSRPSSDRPLIVWNHRWEYDKNPQSFFAILDRLLERGLDFELALLGERFAKEPDFFADARGRLKERIVHYGQTDSLAEYARWLWRSDIALVTSRQDFFGGSVVEAIYCDCWPILPHRLAYPEHIDPYAHPDLYYRNDAEAADRLSDLIASGRWRKAPGLSETVKRYDWTRCIERYDTELDTLVTAFRQSYL